MLRTCLQDTQRSKDMQCFLVDGLLPALASIALFGLHDGLHDGLPSACADGRIAGDQVGTGHLNADARLMLCFIASMKKAHGLGAVACAQTLLLTGQAVLDVEPAATLPTIQSES